MNKSQLIKSTSEKLKLSQKDCLRCINAIGEIIYECLSRGDNVNITGFGKFYVKTTSERRFVNPQTQKPMLVQPKNIPTFKSGKQFKQSIR